MLSQLFQPRLAAGMRDEFVIAPHHPDRLGRPSGRVGALDRDRYQQALTWNVFRTLELIAPAFWLRRLHARLTGEPSPAPPQIAQVSLWRRLPLPPIQRIDGTRPDAVVDVVIETEHAVWTLMVAPADRPDDDGGVAAVIDAGAWLAGAREHHAGIIETRTTNTSFGGRLRERYARSRGSVELRTATRGPARPTSTPPGTLEWTDLTAILEDCQDAPHLAPIERALARNAVEWLRRAGAAPGR
jgi:hypothetical protein